MSDRPAGPEEEAFITLPYTNKKCEDFVTRLKILVNNTLPSIDLNVAYQTIGDFFPYEDKVELPEEYANVVPPQMHKMRR